MQQDGLALVNRITEHGSKYLTFLDNPEIPFTNNQAKQDIKIIKVKQKISDGFRTEKYAKDSLKIRGFIATMRKHRKNIVDAINRVINNHLDCELSISGLKLLNMV